MIERTFEIHAFIGQLRQSSFVSDKDHNLTSVVDAIHPVQVVFGIGVVLAVRPMAPPLLKLQ